MSNLVCMLYSRYWSNGDGTGSLTWQEAWIDLDDLQPKEAPNATDSGISSGCGIDADDSGVVQDGGDRGFEDKPIGEGT